MTAEMLLIALYGFIALKMTEKHFDVIVDVVTNVFYLLKSVVKSITNATARIVKSVPSVVKSIARGVGNAYFNTKDAVITAAQTIYRVIRNAPSATKDGVMAVVNKRKNEAISLEIVAETKRMDDERHAQEEREADKFFADNKKHQADELKRMYAEGIAEDHGKSTPNAQPSQIKNPGIHSHPHPTR